MIVIDVVEAYENADFSLATHFLAFYALQISALARYDTSCERYRITCCFDTFCFVNRYLSPCKSIPFATSLDTSNGRKVSYLLCL